MVNKDTDALLYQKNSTDRIAPASTAKMITALTVLEYCSPEEEMRVGAEIEMIHSDSSTAWLMKGDTLTVRQLLIALMLPSGNDAAYTLAVNIGKTIAGDNSLSNQQAIQIFMDKVNEKAKELGITDSNFVVPDGYDAEGQYTTAYEYVASQSSHSRGSTVDLTIFRLDTGMLVPMGGDFDFMDVRSHHAASGLNEEEAGNRERLRDIMERSGFEAYRYEWWHYVLADEPYPDTYFDFCIA